MYAVRYLLNGINVAVQMVVLYILGKLFIYTEVLKVFAARFDTQVPSICGDFSRVIVQPQSV
jgi:hypothetical protein